MVREYKEIEQLTREPLYQIIERIDVYPKVKSGKGYMQKIDILFHHFGTREKIKKADF